MSVAWPEGAEPALRRNREMVSFRIDRDVLEWFRRGGPGYQPRIAAVLRAYMEGAKDKARAGRGQGGGPADAL